MEPCIIHHPLGDHPPKATLYYGENVTQALRRLPDKAVQMVCTSPPYWGLRSYGVEEQVWGGNNPDCKHEWLGGADYNRGQVLDTDIRPQPTTPVDQTVCHKCGAWRGCLGLEPHPADYVAHIVEVFREVRRVLRDDGTVWLNLGDTYMSHTAQDLSGLGGREGERVRETKGYEESLTIYHRPSPAEAGLKDKDLVGIPWRVAFALQADGWYLRSDIVYHKSNPMPERVTDRPTKSHEYVFLLTKKPHYFYDADAIREPVTGAAHTRGSGVNPKARANVAGCKQNASFSAAVSGLVSSRNKRSVWTLPTQPYTGAHFAVWPSKLVEPMILAGTSKKGCCSKCGAPHTGTDTTVGWEPGCHCEGAEIVPCVVMDIFSGSATTGAVALAKGRNYIGLDMNAEYLKLAESRILGMTAPSQDEEPDNPMVQLFGEQDI